MTDHRLQIPIGLEEAHSGLVDLIFRRAFMFEGPKGDKVGTRFTGLTGFTGGRAGGTQGTGTSGLLGLTGFTGVGPRVKG